MICGLYVITGIKGKLVIPVIHSSVFISLVGPTFWDQKTLTITGLYKVDWVARYIPNVGLNESFMVFGALGLAFNILTRSYHIHRRMLMRTDADSAMAVITTYTNHVANPMNPSSNLYSTSPPSLSPLSFNAHG